MTGIPACRWRDPVPAPSPPGAEPRHYCTSLKLHTRDGTVSASTCRSCNLADHEDTPPRGQPADRKTPLVTVAPPCVHRGPRAGTGKCDRCGQRERDVTVLACTLHKKCTNSATSGVADRVRGVRPCQDCHANGEGFEAPAAPPAEIIPGLADPVPEPAEEATPRGWHRRPDVRERHIAALRHLAGCELPPPGPLAGDGIVMVGGGSKYWPMIALSVRMTRRTGCKLPVQVWHRGSHGEWVRPEDVAGLGVELIDIDRRLPGRRAARGWETKTAAILHCGLARVLFLDADAYPVVNPEERFFPLLEKAPFAYWQDHGYNIKGPYYGFTREQVLAVPSVQGGQYLMDVAGWWRQLVIAFWCDQHGDYFYSRGSAEPRHLLHSWGDQDQLLAAILATGGPYLRAGLARSHPAGCVCELDGEPVIVHRYGNKLLAGRTPAWFDDLPAEADAREAWLAADPPKVAHPHGMSEAQYGRVVAEIRGRGPCRVLVFGAGKDTARYVGANRGGRTVVLEDLPEWLEVGRAAGAECYGVRYATRTTQGVLGVCPPLEVPPSVSADRFDVVLIDGPCGAREGAPGRQQAAQFAAGLAAAGGVVFAHDWQDPPPAGYSDAACYLRHLGTPDEVIPGPPDLAAYRPGQST